MSKISMKNPVTLLREAAEQGDWDRVNELLGENNITAEHKGWALERATKKGHLKIVERLLKETDIPAYHKGVVLQDAAVRQHYNIVATLFEHGAVLDTQLCQNQYIQSALSNPKCNPAFIVAKEDCLQEAKQLVEKSGKTIAVISEKEYQEKFPAYQEVARTAINIRWGSQILAQRNNEIATGVKGFLSENQKEVFVPDLAYEIFKHAHTGHASISTLEAQFIWGYIASDTIPNAEKSLPGLFRYVNQELQKIQPKITVFPTQEPEETPDQKLEKLVEKDKILLEKAREEVWKFLDNKTGELTLNPADNHTKLAVYEIIANRDPKKPHKLTTTEMKKLEAAGFVTFVLAAKWERPSNTQWEEQSWDSYQTKVKQRNEEVEVEVEVEGKNPHSFTANITPQSPPRSRSGSFSNNAAEQKKEVNCCIIV